MKLIRFLQSSIIVLFVFLFSLFFLNIYNENKTINDEPEHVQVMEEEVKIEPIVFSEKKENQEILVIEPRKEETKQKETIQVRNSSKFYYTNLDKHSKIIYESLEKQKNSFKTGNSSIIIPDEIGELIEKKENIEVIFSDALNAFECDNPDLFYLDLSKIVLYYEKNNFGNYRIYLRQDEGYSNYLKDSFNNESDIQKAQSEIDETVKQIQKNVSGLKNDYDKIMYVHDWIIENTEYDRTLKRTNNDTIYGVIVEKKAVCSGYSKTFKYLMDRININCIVVEGIGISEEKKENHEWNYIELKDKWYAIDCTWDDPIIIGDLQYYTERKYYTYFLRGEKEFKDSHIPINTFYKSSTRIYYPELSKEDYS